MPTWRVREHRLGGAQFPSAVGGDAAEMLVAAYPARLSKLSASTSLYCQAQHTIQQCGIGRTAQANAHERGIPVLLDRRYNMIRSKCHVQDPEIQQGNEKVGLADAEGKEGGQAGKEACRGCYPPNPQMGMSPPIAGTLHGAPELRNRARLQRVHGFFRPEPRQAGRMTTNPT